MRRVPMAMLVAAVGLAQGPYPQPRPYGQQQYGQDQPYALQQPMGEDDTGDAPDHAVARVSYLYGNVSVRRGDSGDLVAAVINTPVVVSDRLVTAGGSRAEVQFDWANMIRLGPATEVRFSELQYHRYQVQVAVGTAIFRVLRDSDAQVEISTPSVSLRPLKKGVYRVTVDPDGTSEITVRSGEVEIFSPLGTEQLYAGSTMLVRGGPSDPEFQVLAAIQEDEFERWCADRDYELERSTSYRYVSPDVYGAEDLDRYGRWVNDGSYGNVWVPTVDPGWAPYRAGRWSWLDFYGWTWVSDDPWGWAPYHYGRWYQGSYGWCWYPGPIYSRYYWRPALVGFFGWGSGGSGFGGGFEFGNVGWVPLAPYERYRPWYGHGSGGGYRVNNNTFIVNNTNVTNIYRNARFENGITSMRSGDFGRGFVNNSNFVRTSSNDLARAGMIRGALPLAPTRESRQFSNRAPSIQGLPRTSDNTSFFSRQGMNQGSPRTFGNMGGAQPGAAGPFSNGRSRGAVQPGGSPGNFGPGQSGVAPDNRPQNNGGWRRFDSGQPNQSRPDQRGYPPGNRPMNNGVQPQSRPDPGSYSPGPAPGDRGQGSVAPGNRPMNNGGWRNFGSGNRPVQPQSRPDPRSYSPGPATGDRGQGSVSPGNRPMNNGGGRNFGSSNRPVQPQSRPDPRSYAPAPGNYGQGSAPPVNRPMNNGGWRNFDPGSRPVQPQSRPDPGSYAPAPGNYGQGSAPPVNRPMNNGGWRNFDPGSRPVQPQSRPDPGSYAPAPRNYTAPAPQQPIYDRGHGGRPERSFDRGYTPAPAAPSYNPSYAPPPQQPPPQSRGFDRPQPAQVNQYSAPPQPRAFNPPPQQPVHINPPIVQNRGGGNGNNERHNNGRHN